MLAKNCIETTKIEEKEAGKGPSLKKLAILTKTYHYTPGSYAFRFNVHMVFVIVRALFIQTKLKAPNYCHKSLLVCAETVVSNLSLRRM